MGHMPGAHGREGDTGMLAKTRYKKPLGFASGRVRLGAVGYFHLLSPSLLCIPEKFRLIQGFKVILPSSCPARHLP